MERLKLVGGSQGQVQFICLIEPRAKSQLCGLVSSGEYKELRITKTILRMNKIRGLTQPYIKTYFIHCGLGPWNRIGNPKRDTCI